LAGLIACGDVIGSEDCVNTSCGAPPKFRVEQLQLSFIDVSTADAGMLVPSWVIPNSCTDCTLEPQLFPAGGDAIWNVLQGATPPAVERIDRAGNRSAQTVTAPDPSTPIADTFMGGQSDGSLLVHLQWAAAMGRSADEIAVLGGAPQRYQLNTTQVSRPPAIISAPDGYLMFDDAPEDDRVFNYVQRVDTAGKVLWQKSGFPNPVGIVGGGAVASGQGYVLSARPTANGSATLWRLLWLGEDGTLTRASEVYGSAWRGLKLVDRGDGRFIAVAPSDLSGGTGSDPNVEQEGASNQGNIDIVSFEQGNPQAAYRVKRSCFYQLDLHGFSVDAAGDMFVSSIAGTPEQSRGLLCRIPVTGVPRCWQTDANRKLGAIVALDANTVIAALANDIVRFDL
jgi:hypothetical protein